MAKRLEMDPKALAARIDKAVGTLKNWRVSGAGPKFIKRAGRIYYPIEEVKKWEREQNRLRQSTKDGAR